ncbi:sulfur carrier protein ThiS [Anaeromicropila populeti]|uniref:Sulfur carrier protein n=1 Tax=Anaeromicropila populeti TaxID=37658 RepID=A0A1I6KKA5_9FIRM|nr:sulfur carrier protein ThiS [Anaeromicropila populeti]SFR91631.1 sulfur carrier protein [Anaeromicropila populeti]
MKWNGNEVILEKETFLLALLEERQYALGKIAVELNGEIVPKSRYAEVIIQNKDIIEVVSFVGGG